jgi:hypothetical protein
LDRFERGEGGFTGSFRRQDDEVDALPSETHAGQRLDYRAVKDVEARGFDRDGRMHG